MVIGEPPIATNGVQDELPEHDTVVVATVPKSDGKPLDVQYERFPTVGTVEVPTVPEPPPPPVALIVTAPVEPEMVTLVPATIEVTPELDKVFPENEIPEPIVAEVTALVPAPVMIPPSVEDAVPPFATDNTPVISPTGIEGVFAEAAVIRPFAFTVNEGMDDTPPNEPTLPLTVARVEATEPGPDAVTSPVRAVM